VKSVRRRLLVRPPVGATAVFAAIRPHSVTGAGSVRADWIQWLSRYSGYCLVVACGLIAFAAALDGHPLPLRKLGLLLGLYTLYTIVLELASRLLQTYDRPIFRGVRLGVALTTVTALITLDPNHGSYFWFFFVLPALQALIYFGQRGLIIVDLVVVVLYFSATSGVFSALPTAPDPVTVLLNSAILLFVSGLLSWLFSAAQAHRTLGYVTALQKISGKVVASLSLPEALQVTVTEGTRATGAAGGSVMLWSPVSRRLEMLAWIEDGHFDSQKTHRTFALGEGIAGLVAETGALINVPDVSSESRYSPSFTARRIRSLLVVPIMSGGHVAGTLSVDSPYPGFFRREAQEFLAALGDYLGIALETHRLRKVTAALSTLGIDDVLQRLIADAAEITGADSATLFLKDRETGAIVRKARFPEKPQAEAPRASGGLTAMVLASGQSVRIGDAASDTRTRPSVIADGVRSILGVPLIAGLTVDTPRDERVIGVLFVNSQRPDLFSARDETLLRDVAGQAAVAIDNGWLYKDSQWRLEQLLTLQEVSAALQRERNLQALLDLISNRAATLLDGDSAAILQKDESGDYLTIRGSHGLSRRTVVGVRVRVGESFAGRAVNSDTAVIAHHIPTDERAASPYLREEGFVSLICVQLKTLGGDAIGTLSVHSKTRPHAFSNKHADILRLLASQAAAAIANAAALEPALRRAQEATTLEALYKESVDLTRPKPVPTLIRSILKTAVATLQSDGGGLYLCDTPGGEPRLAAVEGLPETEIGKVVPVGSGVVGEVVRDDVAHTMANYSTWPNRVPWCEKYGFSAVASAPISWQGERRGAIAVHTLDERRTYTPADLNVLSLLGTFAAVALENARRTDEYDRLFDSSLDAIVVIDEHGKIMNVNPQAERIFGAFKNDVLGRQVTDFYANSTDAKEVKQLLRAADNDRIEDYPTSVRSLSSGEIIPISLSASLLRDYERTPAGSVGFFRDLRELKSTHRELSLLRNVLSASRATTRISERKRVLEVIVATAESTARARGVILWRCVDGRIRPAEAVISPTLADSVDTSRLARETLEGMMRAREICEGVGLIFGDEPNQVEGPRDAWVGCPLRIGARDLGLIVGLYGDQRPITERERTLFQLFADVAAIAINNADQTIELESATWISALASWHAELAHDIETEVGSIRRSVLILQSGPELPPSVNDELSKIDSSAEAIALPIGNQSGSADLVECIRREVEEARSRWPSIDWELSPTDLRQPVVIAASWMRRIIRNFLRNAATAMPPAWPTRRVVVNVSNDSMNAFCRIADSGPGLPEELEPIVFRQLIKRNDSMGSGLLLISSTLKHHGGAAALLSNSLGHGACFEIRIPLVPDGRA
jgi:PAS domain S-box-containing protein